MPQPVDTDRNGRGRRSVKTRAPKRSLTDQVYKELRRQIIGLELPPGARFTEGEVTRMLGIGKTPVREALARLVQRRLARNIPRVGYEVAPVTLLDVQQICDLRLIVEPEAARLAVGRIDPVRIRELDELCMSTYGNDATSDIQDFIDANHQFHLAVAAASGNDRLLEVVEHLLDESERLYRIGLWLQPKPEELVHKHEDLVDALVAGDVERVMSITAEQIRDFRDLVIDALLATSSILSAPVGLPEAGDQSRPARFEVVATRGADRA